MTTTLHVMQAEHFSVPGQALSVHESKAGAERAAAEAVRVMRADHVAAHGEGCPEVAGDDFAACIAYLQDFHGAAHCYAEVTATPLHA